MLGKKLTLAAAGNNQSGAAGPLNVEDVFSTYLYTGTGSTQTVTNGIDLSGEGGLVWTKSRTENVYTGYDHTLFDTERGMDKRIGSNKTGAQISGMTFSATSTGFTDGYNTVSTEDMVSWTFRKAPKFFDVVTWTGDGTNNRQISHNLGSNIGMVICKSVSGVSTWAVKHKDRPTDEGQLNSTNAFAGYGNFPTSFAGFTDSYFTVDAGGSTNANGYTYVAYLFAHNDGDGVFGPNEDQDIIKCGSYTGTTEVNLGFEPQFILRKKADGTGNWAILDTMRGWGPFGGSHEFNYLLPNTDDPEGISYGQIPTSTGFTNTAPGTFIYVAIRRGPMAVPTSGTDVFALDYQSPGEGSDTFIQTGFPVDTTFYSKLGSGSRVLGDRLRGTSGGGDLVTSSIDAEASNEGSFFLDHNDGVTVDASGGHFNASPAATDEDYIRYFWRRAPSFYDVVTLTKSTTPQTFNHNLGVTPEMIILKSRTSTYGHRVWHKDVSGYQEINSDAAFSSYTDYFGTHTATQFVLGGHAPGDYIARLYATLDGVSKVGSYTGNGQEQTIDCGFSNGARFVLIRRVDSSGDWTVLDTARTYNTGTDYWIDLNTTAAQSSGNTMTARSSGFGVRAPTYDAANLNVNGATYIFYAIA